MSVSRTEKGNHSQENKREPDWNVHLRGGGTKTLKIDSIYERGNNPADAGRSSFSPQRHDARASTDASISLNAVSRELLQVHMCDLIFHCELNLVFISRSFFIKRHWIFFIVADYDVDTTLVREVFRKRLECKN